MADIKTLTWALEILRLLMRHVVTPLTMARLREIYPEINRTTMLNRLDSLVAAGWAMKVDGGWVLHPSVCDLHRQAYQGFVAAMSDGVERAKAHGLDLNI